MKHKLHYLPGLLLLAFLLWGRHDASAQTDSLLFHQNTQILPEGKGELRLKFDNINFVRDNEYQGRYAKGYTLPGLWMQPTLSFQPLRNLRVEAGAYLLHYWGANKYPNLNYSDLAEWKGEQTQKGFHCLPVFRVQVSLTPNFDIVLGTLYGKNNHRLVEPLYNPEMGLSGDPEAGIQLLWNCRPLELDAWVNWESFIFRSDTHQEAFCFGISTRFKANAPQAKAHVYFPLQAIFQHRGGEVNPDATSRKIKTWLNAAAGLGLDIHPRSHIFTRLNLEATATYFGQQAGDMLPFDKGYGIYAKATADLWRFRIQAGYAICHNFISIYGNPLFGAIAVDEKDLTFRNPQMIVARLEYAQPIGKGFALGIHADAFQHFSTDAFSASQGAHKEANSLSLAAGLYLRVNLDWLIKRF